MSRQDIPLPSVDDDYHGELADRRYEAALAAVTTYDVLAITCDILSEWSDYRSHPLAQLASHVLRHGSTRRCGKPPHFGDRLTRDLEHIVDEAIERCITDALNSDVE